MTSARRVRNAVRIRLTRTEGTAPGGQDAGSITVLIVFLALALVMIAGLVFDAGGALTDRQRATDIAEQAARYAADQVVPAAAGATPLINPAKARTAGLEFLRREGVTGTVEATTTQATVTVTIQHRTTLLGAIGIDALRVQGTSSATPLTGLKTAGTTGGD